MEHFLPEATLYLAAIVAAVPIAARLGLGSVLGYLAAGIVIGPALGLVGGAEAAGLRQVAEFGVVMMLFLVGLELEPKALWEMRGRLLGLGGLQVGVTAGAVLAGGLALGLPWQTAFAVGLILALSSTAIVLQTFEEKSIQQRPGARTAFAVLLAQDIAVIPMLAFLPLLAIGAAAGGGETESLIAGLPGWLAALATLGAVAAVVLGGHYLTRPLFKFVQLAHLREINTAVALLIVVGIASLMTLVGLSPALGTFIAGVVLASSEFRHELTSDLAPFKGLLLGLFFITVGAGIDFGVLASQAGSIIGLTAALMLAKGAILWGLGRAFRLRDGEVWLFALSLAQAGEFGFVLVSFGAGEGVLPEALARVLPLVIAMSMLLTPLAFILWERLSRRLDRTEAPEPDEIDTQEPILIAGIGRFGQVVNRLVQTSGFRTTVLDPNLETIELMRMFGLKAFLGDPTRPDLLQAAGLATAKVLVVALAEKDDATRLVAYARKERPDLHIVARAYDRVHVYELYRAGANDIVREMFDSSLRAGRYVLERMGFSDYEAAEQQAEYYRLDRRAVRELAALWQPGVRVDKNEAYVKRARAMNKEFETALMARLDKTDTAA